MSVPKGEIVVQAFIQALLSTAIFSQRLSFLLFTRSLNMDIRSQENAFPKHFLISKHIYIVHR